MTNVSQKDSLIYRQPVTLRDGSRMLLRPLLPSDRQALIDLFEEAGPEEVQTMRHNVSDPAVVGKWVDELDYEHVLPIVAVVGERIVGESTLHMRSGYERHIGEVRIYLAAEFRTRGLGTRLLQAMVELGRRRGLLMLVVNSLADKKEDSRAFQNAGFVVKCTFEDGFMQPDGTLHDVVNLVLRLRPADEEY
jgi:L-amino acid N-acyltransferase YncA